MDKLLELRKALLDEMQKLISTAETEKRDFTEEEDSRIAEIRKEIKTTDDKLGDLQFLAEQRKRQDDLAKDLEKAGQTRHYHPGGSEGGGQLLPGEADERNLAKFSITKFLRESVKGRLTGVEKELHEEAEIEARACGTQIENFGIPQIYVGTRAKRTGETRDHTAGTTTEGGHTVATDLRGFIPALRDRMVLTQLGARFLTGLQGNIAFPKHAGATSPGEVAENATAGEENVTFGILSLSPSRLASFSDVSKQLLIQSSEDVQGIITEDLLIQSALRIQDQAINGTGLTVYPEGILNATGIGDVAGGTNGLAPTHNHIVDLETAIADDNADMGSLGYLTNTAVRGKLKKTKVDVGSGLFVWPANANELNGYRVLTSNTVPRDLDKGSSTGVCSAIIFGNWADLIIGQWGGLDVLVNPYTKGKEGFVEVIVTMFYDVGLRHPESFAAMQDALTA